MRSLIGNVISCYVWSCDMEIKIFFLHKSPSKRLLRNGIHILQLAKASCCQRERWHHLLYVTHVDI